MVLVSTSSRTANLKCHSGCSLPPHPSFIWYKNGERIQTVTSSSYSDRYDYPDRYSCALQGHEDSPSPPVCAYEDRCNRVTYTDRRICAPKGSSMDISCTYNSYDSYYSNTKIASKFWFNPELSGNWQSPSLPEDLIVDSQYAGHVQVLETKRGHSALRISDLRESDSAEYRFRFSSGSFEWRNSLPGTTLTVTALQVQVQVITAGESYTKAELRCLSSCSPPGRLSYVWFMNREKINGEETPSFTGWIPLGHEISCAFKGHEGFPSPPVYAPKLPSVSVSPSAEIVENSSVTLTCSSDANPAAVTYTWYKNGNPDFQPFSKEAQLVFSSIQPSDSGEYYCEAENQLGKRTSEHLTIDVKYPPKLPSVSMDPSGEIMEGSSVTLKCSSDANPAANYTWYKGNDRTPQGSGPVFTINDVTSEHSGDYYCEADNRRGRHNSTLQLVLSNKSILMMNAIRLTLVIVIPLLVLPCSLWMRKKTILSSTTEPDEPAETVELDSDPEYINDSALHSTSAL
ncbi:B-cell receptor CD22-like [Notolabrus celidotus]|uniref:B-cell receptor CD22-like n=1 Tax=Notolabrus celidotus TaxID=1203425 RepID=UPI00148FF318|nr:B-cell receptor CD22-like [Notolabrus celidotus]